MDEARYREVEGKLWSYLEVEPTEHMVSLPSTGTAVRIQELGEGPPILFVHGGAINGASWASLAAELQQFRCLLLDRPGCGLSPRLANNPNTIAELISYCEGLVPDVLDGLDLKSAHVVCTSLGGMFGFHGAATQPDRYDKLIGIGSIFGSPMDNIPLIMRIGSVGPMAKLMARMPPSRQAVRAVLRQIGLKDAVKAGRVPREFEDWFLASMKYTDVMTNEAADLPPVITIKGIAPEAVMTSEMLAKINSPTKLIWGDSDPMAGAEIARRFADALPNAELELWPNVGHAPWMDDPVRAARSITDFLAD